MTVRQHEHRRLDIAQDRECDLGIARVALDRRDAERLRDVREARRIACDDGDLCLAREESLHDAEAEAAATTGDDDALIFESLHVRSFAAMTIDAGEKMRSA